MNLKNKLYLRQRFKNMDWMQILVTVLCSLGSAVIGGVIGGFFTVLATRMNHKHEDEAKQKEWLREAIKTKPRLELLDYQGFEMAKDSEQEKADISVLVLAILGFEDKNGRAFFTYDKKAINNKNLMFVEYLLENTGPTEIEEVCVAGNYPRFVSVLDMNQKDAFIREGLLNYDVWSDKRYIKTKQTIKIRVYYLKNQIPASLLSNPSLTIWLKDVNGLLWSQTLLAPGKEIEISRLKKYEDFKGEIDIRSAIDCFRNPELW